MTGVSETAAVSQNPVVFDIFEQRLKASALKQTLAVLPEADRDQLVDQIEDLARRLDTLVEATQKVRERLSYDVLLTRLISLITEAFDADRSSLFLFDAESKELFARVAQGDLVSEIRFPCDRGIAGSVFQSGEPAIVDDAYDDPRFNPAVDVDTGFRTRNILCVPVRTRSGDIIGVTEVLNTNKGRFTNADSVLLQAFTTHTAAAIETAHFGQIARESQREEAHIMEVTQAVSSELNIEKLLRKIISIATDLLEAERSTLFLHDPTTDELWSRVAEGMDEREIRIPSTIGIAGEVFSTRTSVNIPDAYTDGRFNQEVDKKTGFRTRSILCVPVINKHGIAIGVVQVLNRRGGPFRLRDQRRLEMLAAQSAIALDNARLFREVLDERNYSENVLRSLSDAVITLDNACNIVKVNKAACTILHTRADVILGAPADSVFSGPNQWVLDSVGKVMQRNEADASLDVSLHTLNGHTVSINLNVTPLTDTEGASLGCTMIMEDLTEEKRIRTTMARYMNTKIVDQVLAEGESALEGRLQNATILFSDIKDFTAIAERVGP